MKVLYHFTSNHLIERIRKEGLTKGIFPHHIDAQSGRVVAIGGYQWLTRESSFDQPWALLGNLPLARASWRITIAIPENYQRKLAYWPALVDRVHPACADDFNAIPGSSDWYLYHGSIRPQWFLALERNLGETMRPDILREAQ